MFKTKGLIATVALAGAVFAGPALAGDSNGNFQIKVGATYADFDNKTNSLVPNFNIFGLPVAGTDLTAAGLGATAESTWVPTATLTYYLNKNLAIELFCCAAGTSVIGKGPLINGVELAHTYVFPPVLTLQYHFDNMGPFRPYVGVGAEWIHFFPSTNIAGDVHIKDVFGVALQAGIDYDLGGGWSLGIDVKKIWANDAKVTWQFGGGAELVAKHQLDPLYVTANIGYRFNLSDLFGRRSEPVPLK